MARGADVRAVDADGRTAILIAAAVGHEAIALHLLQLAAGFGVLSPTKESAVLAMAARPRLPLLLQALLQQMRDREPPVPTSPLTPLWRKTGKWSRRKGAGRAGGEA